MVYFLLAMTNAADSAAPFDPPPSARSIIASSDTTSWRWRDLTEAMAALGFPARTTRYIEVAHDAGFTILSLDEDGHAQTHTGVEVDELLAHEVAHDALGLRRYEAENLRSHLALSRLRKAGLL